MAGRAAGLLAPDTPEGRVLVDLSSGKERVFQVTGDAAEPLVEIGPYRFRAAAFEWGNAVLARANAEMIVVDEVGPLELRGEGLADGVRAVLRRASGTVICVVREGLIERAATYFEVAPEVVPLTDWPAFAATLTGAP